MNATRFLRWLTYCRNIKFGLSAASRSILLLEIGCAVLETHNVSARLMTCRWGRGENLLYWNIIPLVKPLVICEFSCRTAFSVHLVANIACSVQATLCQAADITRSGATHWVHYTSQSLSRISDGTTLPLIQLLRACCMNNALLSLMMNGYLGGSLEPWDKASLTCWRWTTCWSLRGWHLCEVIACTTRQWATLTVAHHLVLRNVLLVCVTLHIIHLAARISLRFHSIFSTTLWVVSNWACLAGRWPHRLSWCWWLFGAVCLTYCVKELWLLLWVIPLGASCTTRLLVNCLRIYLRRIRASYSTVVVLQHNTSALSLSLLFWS